MEAIIGMPIYSPGHRAFGNLEGLIEIWLCVLRGKDIVFIVSLVIKVVFFLLKIN